jgi:hypothetical protein
MKNEKKDSDLHCHTIDPQGRGGSELEENRQKFQLEFTPPQLVPPQFDCGSGGPVLLAYL